jgi:hypothetical protein
MKADLSRWTFDHLKGYARVLQQQGRPQVDADWNEQVSILLYRLHMLSRDLIGPFGGPSDACGFEITSIEGEPHNFDIGRGRYYVDGWLVENPAKVRFSEQPLTAHGSPIETGKHYLVYLDVWESVISAADDRLLIEPAFGGLESALRTRVAWQVRTHEIQADNDADFVFNNWNRFVENWQPSRRGELRARIAPAAEERLPEQSLIASARGYRGLENQLYRVEIHYGGAGTGGHDGATFKWSRDNGAVMLRLMNVRDNVLTFDRLDAAGAGTLMPGNWLEESAAGASHPATRRGSLIHVVGRGPGPNQVTIDPSTMQTALDPQRPNGVWLRRWDQRALQINRGGAPMRDGTITITEGQGQAGWIALEHGVEVQFSPGATYRPGDYWLIPARIGDQGRLLWPGDRDGSRALPPLGSNHGYAPLATVEFTTRARRKQSCRRQFKLLATTAI